MKKISMLVALLATLSMVSACSSSGTTGAGNNNTNNNGGTSQSESEDVGTGTGDATDDSLSTMNTALTKSFSGLGSALGGGATLVKAAAIANTTVACSTGSASVSGDVTSSGTSSSYEIDITFNNCEGLNGSLNFSGDYAIVGSNLEYSMAFDGSVGGNGCSVDFNTLEYNIDLVGGVYDLRVNGGISSSCGSESGSCTWNNVSLTDTAALEAGCTF